MSIGLLSEKDFAARMVARYRELLLRAAGMTSISVDGQQVSYTALENGYATWLAKLNRLNNTRPLVLSIGMTNAQ